MTKSYVGMTNCFYCNGAKDILIDRRLKDSLETYVGVVDTEPCNECNQWMQKGVILISIKNETTEEEMKPVVKEVRGRYGRTEEVTLPPNPYRTGKWAVIKDEAIERWPVPQELIDYALNHRFMFLTDEVWERFGLPEGEENEKS